MDNTTPQIRVADLGSVPIFQLTDSFTAHDGRELATKIIAGLRAHCPHLVHEECTTTL